MSKKKTTRGSRPIVVGHLEKISSRVFDDYRNRITELIRGEHGVYALYRREKLYYVGLATDLRKRINQHLRDRHEKKWTHFSLYILRKSDHLRELETLLLRIADPTGNYVKGKLQRSKDLRPALKVMITEDFKKSMDDILGIRKKGRRKKEKGIGKVRGTGGEPPLKGLMKNGKGIYRNYKGKTFKGIVYSSGIIRLRGKRYLTPTAAALSIVDRGTVNGWNFWKYKDGKGNLVPLKKLRK
jgi:hypothetical protein